MVFCKKHYFIMANYCFVKTLSLANLAKNIGRVENIGSSKFYVFWQKTLARPSAFFSHNKQGNM